jgi:hypothetical protein
MASKSFAFPVIKTFVVNQATAGDQLDPSFTVLKNGGFVISYSTELNAEVDAWRFDANGDRLGRLMNVNQDSFGDQTGVALTTLAKWALRRRLPE